MIRTRTKLFISISVGCLAAGILVMKLENHKKEIQAQTTMTTVLKAKRYLKKGSTLKSDMVEEIPIPAAFLQPTALQNKDHLVDAEGKSLYRTRIEFMKGEQLTMSKLFDDRVFLGLAWALEPGQLALSLRLTPEQAIGGWLHPGDHVHIFGTMEKQTDWPETKTVLLLRRVPVLTVGKNVFDPGSSLGEKKVTNSLASESILITIGVSPREATVIALARKRGQLTLALVSPMDVRPSPWVETRLTDLK